LTIEYAVNTVSDPTTATIVIHVSAGTYTLNSNEVGIDRNFTNLTIQGAGIGVTIVQAESTEGTATKCVFLIGSDETVLIEKMTIRYGRIANDFGGGIWISYSTLTLTNCIICNNSASWQGGGIYNRGGSLSLVNCTISGNSVYASGESHDGGGIYNYLGTCSLTNCTVSGNTAVYDGGGIYSRTTMTLANCTISGNDAGNAGGGIYNTNNTTLTNCTVSNNTAAVSSGGIRNAGGTLYIKNTILANNTTDGSADDFYKSSGTVNNNGYNLVEIQNGSDFVNGVDGCIAGEQASLNLSSALADNSTINGTQTLKLTSGSVAINAGTSVQGSHPVATPTTDQRGAERSGNVDIGAYEYWDDDGSLPVELTYFTVLSGDGQIILNWITESEIENLGFNICRSANKNDQFPIINDQLIPGAGTTSSRHEYEYVDEDAINGITYWYKLEDVDYTGNSKLHGPVSATPYMDQVATQFRLYPACPNPFNPMTVIRYDLSGNEWVSITIYDLLGNQINTLVDRFQSPGSYRIEWNGFNNRGQNVSAGVYFIRLQSGNNTAVQKCLVTR